MDSTSNLSDTVTPRKSIYVADKKITFYFWGVSDTVYGDSRAGPLFCCCCCCCYFVLLVPFFFLLICSSRWRHELGEQKKQRQAKAKAAAHWRINLWTRQWTWISRFFYRVFRNVAQSRPEIRDGNQCRLRCRSWSTTSSLCSIADLWFTIGFLWSFTNSMEPTVSQISR